MMESVATDPWATISVESTESASIAYAHYACMSRIMLWQ